LTNSISRRDFLKFLGLGTTAIALGSFGGMSQLLTSLHLDNGNRYSNNNNKKQSAFAQEQSTGLWTNTQNCTVTPIHAALLPSGKIFYLAGSGYNTARQYGPYDARVLDVNTGQEKVFNETNSPMTEDLFCMGQTTLANGNLLFAGGTAREGYFGNPNNCNGTWHGLKSAYEFDINSEQFVKVASMRQGRWYPTLITLPDGKVWCCQGYDEYGVPNRIIEVYNPSTKTWALVSDPGSGAGYCAGEGHAATCPGAGSPCYTGVCPANFTYYPRAHLMPNGKIVICGMQREIYSWNPADGRFSFLASSSTFRFYGTSFLLPLNNTPTEKGRVMITGGSPQVSNASYGVTTCEILDFNASSTEVPVIRTVSPVTIRRKYSAPVILPDGKCIIFGGTESGPWDAVYKPEMFDPVTQAWRSDLPPAWFPRPYHQVAILLPDGRIWNAGGAPDDGSSSVTAQFFSPGYLFAGARPTISGAPTVGAYGGTISIPTPDAPTISSNPSAWKVSLVRLINATHHYEANQRLVWLQILNAGSTSVTVSAPINGSLAPPGDYMIFIVNPSGVPSVGRIVRVPGTGGGGGGTTPTQVTNLTATPISSSQINLGWTANPTSEGVTSYNVYRSTVSGFTPSTQNLIAQPTTNSYSNTGLAASTTYYYKVAAVNSAGIGPSSTQISATTSATGGGDSTPPSITITSPQAGSSVPRGNITFLGTSSDNTGGSGVRDVYTSLDGGTYTIATSTNSWANWSKTYRIQGLTSHTLSARATDNAGNTRSTSITFNVVR
jgi:hypothetical protein